jgi:hypothetical protein
MKVLSMLLMDKETGVSKEVSKEEFMKVNASNPLKKQNY